MVLKLLLGAVLGLLPLLAVAAEDAKIMPENDWVPRGALALPGLADDVPTTGAGCVVVSHLVDVDGSSHHPRILKSAYAGGVEAAMQRRFAADVLAKAKAWQFKLVKPERGPASFRRLQTIGFIPGDGQSARVVADIDALPKELRTVCHVESLAKWGEANAVTIEQARANHAGDEVVVGSPGSGKLYWVRKTFMQPFEVPGNAIRGDVDACIVVGFVIGIDGKVTNVMILKSDVESEVGLSHARDMTELMENTSMVYVADLQFSPGPDNLRRRAQFKQLPIGYRTGTHHSSDCEVLTTDELAQVLQG